MHTLSHDQLNQVKQHIRQTKPHPALQVELVDHMAALIERQINQGQDFQTAFQWLVQQTSPQVMQGLNQQYDQTFRAQRSPGTQVNRRVKQRLATKPFYYMFLSCGLTLMLLMGSFMLLIGRPLALSNGVFHPTWIVGLAAVGAVGLVRLWLTSRSPKPFTRR